MYKQIYKIALLSKMTSFLNSNMTRKQIKPFKIGQCYININNNIQIKMNIEKCYQV